MTPGTVASWWDAHPQTRALSCLLADRARAGAGVVEILGPLGSGAEQLVLAAADVAATDAGLPTSTLRVDPNGAVVGRPGARGIAVVLDADRLDPTDLASLTGCGSTLVLVHDGHRSLGVTADHTVVTRPLTVADARRALDDVGLGHAVDPALLVAHTGGGAGVVLDLVAELATAPLGAPVTLGSTVSTRAQARVRLERLDAAARSLVEHVALLGGPDGLGLDDLGHLLHVDEAAPLVDAAAAEGLVVVSADHGRARVAPLAPVWARAVADATPLLARRAVHEHAAAAAADDLSRLTHLVLAAERPDPDLVARLAELGHDAALAGSWGIASTTLGIAAEATTDPTERDRLAPAALDAAIASGELTDIQSLVDAVRRLPSTVASDTALGTLSIMRGRSAAADAHLERAWNGCNPRTRPEEASLVAGRLGLQALCRWRPDDLARWGEAAARLGDPAGPARLEAEAIGAIGLAAAGREDRAHAVLTALLREHPTGPRHQRAALAAGWVEYATGDPDTASGWLEEATNLTGDGSHRITVWAYGWLARARFDAGQWASALRLVDTGLALCATTRLTLGEPLLRWTAAQVHALRGHWDLAERHAQPLGHLDSSYLLQRVPAALAAAVTCEARSDYHGVVRHLRPLAELDDRTGIDEPGFWDWHQHHANALVAIGSLDEADVFLTPLEEHAARSRRPAPVAALATARGRWHGTRGDLDAAEAAFRDAAEAADRARRPYQRARIHYAHGVVLRRAGQRRRAADELHTALRAFDALGAAAYVDRCRRELTAAGVDQPRDDRRSSMLTPQEGAVATLVAAGRSNREVAHELNVSVKTVQYHLTNIYGKLQVRGRSELAARQGELLG